MRTFRVVLSGGDNEKVSDFFTVNGGLQRLHAGAKYRSRKAAHQYINEGVHPSWTAYIVRRVRGGWVHVCTYERTVD